MYPTEKLNKVLDQEQKINEGIIITKNLPNNLGWSNGWDKVPDIVKNCTHKKSERSRPEKGRCVTETICNECNYTFLTDSGD